MAIRHGDGNWPGLDVVRLCPERLFPVCSPKLARRKRILTTEDLFRLDRAAALARATVACAEAGSETERSG